MLDLTFYQNKRVLITGHSGFKGGWLCKLLKMAGAQITGYALKPESQPAIFELAQVERDVNNIVGDVRDLKHLKQVFGEIQPEIVIHMAAQPLVKASYENPVYTYEVNVMGTVNVLECVRLTRSVKSFLNVTTDKVYLNREWLWGYRENEELNGFDPYSNSKSCSELVTGSYVNSFFKDENIAVSTVRAGNVIGGGDFAKNRIIPDCIRAVQEEKKIVIRNPYSVRPYEHVLEALMVYLMICQKQCSNISYAGNYNVGPDEDDCYTTGELVNLFCEKWYEMTGKKVEWENREEKEPHEAGFLKLDCSKLKRTFGWKPYWNIETAMTKIVEWTRVYLDKGDVSGCMEKQISEYISSFANR